MATFFARRGDSVDINIPFSTQVGTKMINQRRLAGDRVRLDWFTPVGIAGHGCCWTHWQWLYIGTLNIC